MATSQNGWSVLPYGSPEVTSLVVDGVSFAPGVRKGDVHTVLQWVAEQVAARTGEKPIKGQCWGQSVRGIRGGTGYSNHASATAIDYNSLRHPQYKPGTWSPAQVKAIQGIIAECDGVVRWGGTYDDGDLDLMHFEIEGNAAQVAALARKIRAMRVSPTGAGGSGGTYETYRHGVKPGSRVIGQNTDGPWSAGDDVKALQRTLNAWYPGLNLVVDGLFGPATAAAVRDNQRRAGLAVDGFVGPKTWKELGF